jgi:hypothetical protein
MTYNAMDAEALIGSEIAGRKGDTVVSCEFLFLPCT